MFEDILTWLLISGAVLFLIVIPIFKFIKAVLPPPKRNALAEAKERLEQARIEVEAAKLNKQVEKMYEEMYQDTLEPEESNKQENRK